MNLGTAIGALIALALLLALYAPARAQTINGITCDDVRRLTALERWYWIKRLKLTPAEVEQIKRTCQIGQKKPRR